MILVPAPLICRY